MFLVVMGIVVWISVKIVAKDQRLKAEHKCKTLVDSDLRFEGKSLSIVLGLGFFGGWVAGALGLGGGTIYNPMLISLGVPPKTSSATGMYLIAFSTLSTSVLFIIFGQLLLDYGLWMGFWSCVGAMAGLKGANWYMKKFDRQSIILGFLAFILFFSFIGVPFFGYIDLAKSVSLGGDIMAFKSFCE